MGDCHAVLFGMQLKAHDADRPKGKTGMKL